MFFLHGMFVMCHSPPSRGEDSHISTVQISEWDGREPPGPLPLRIPTPVLTDVSLVQLDLSDLFAFGVQRVLDVDLRGVVGVGAELHGADLPVEGEVLHLDGEGEH